jgi:hypothetical protein
MRQANGRLGSNLLVPSEGGKVWNRLTWVVQPRFPLCANGPAI